MRVLQLFLVFALAVGPVWAQPAPAHGPFAAHGVKRAFVYRAVYLADHGHPLTDSQKASLRALHQARARNLQALGMKYGWGTPAFEAEARQVRQQSRREIQAVFTPEQQALLQELRQKMREQRLNAGSGPPTDE